MDELSWQARLAKQNINILDVSKERWFYEFMYHPYPGQTKWCKTFYNVPMINIAPKDRELFGADELIERDPEEIAAGLIKEVAKLRRELEK